MTIPTGRSLPLLAVLVAGGLTAPAAAQERPRFEAAYGPWWPEGDSVAQVFHAGVEQRFWGPLGYGFALVHVADGGSLVERTLSGAELTLRLGRPGGGLYALAGAGLGVRHTDGNADAFWTAGGGVAFRVLAGAALGVEVRYRAEDTGVAGFWQLAPDDRTGLQAQARITFGIPRGPSSTDAPPASGAGAPAAEPAAPGPTADASYDEAVAAGASEEAARLTASVVETALGAMGSPYNWGGSGENGFDCSGLIQYAYGQHGIVLPRISRDQMRMGSAVDRSTAALRPGDVLGFSAEGSSEVSHVGLYVGGGRFIHSSSSGVTLSGLDAADPDSRWWRDRWVAARRIVE
jgi:cell wall-associated NlpC family hydrolase